MSMTKREKLAFLIGRRRSHFAVQEHTTTKGKRLDLKRFHYLLKPYADIAPDIVLVCGVQSGKTEWSVVDAFAVVSFGASYQLVQPKDDAVATFTRTRILQPIKRSAFYEQHMKSMYLNRLFEWKTDTAETGILRVVFSTVEDEMKSFPADVTGVDEVDACKLPNLSLLKDRSMGSEYGLTRYLSTPTTVGNEAVQNIWWRFLQTDQQRYYLECKKCGTWQILDWLENFVEERRDDGGKLIETRLRDDSWRPDSGRDIYAICKSCGSPVDRLSPGEWHPTERLPTYITKRGYHWNKFSSPLIYIRDQWEDYQKATHSPFILQRFYNSVCGLPYQGAGTKITEEMLNACVGLYPISPETATCKDQCSMGVDVGPRWLDVRISSYPKDTKDIRKAEYIGKVKSFANLHELIERFNVRVCVTDAEPETHECLRFKETAKCGVFVCYTKRKKGYQLSDLLLEKVKEEKKFTIDRTVMMDCVLATYAKRQHILPKNIRFLSEGNYVSEMTNPTRVLEVDENTGQEEFVWTHGNDHSFLADVYDFCAMLLGYFRPGQYGILQSERPEIMMTDPMDDLDLYKQMA